MTQEEIEKTNLSSYHCDQNLGVVTVHGELVTNRHRKELSGSVQGIEKI